MPCLPLPHTSWYLLPALLTATWPAVAQSTAPAVEWQLTAGGKNRDQLSRVVPSADGGYLLAGFSDSDASGDKTQPGHGLTDFWVVKLDAQGRKLWDRCYGGAGADVLWAAQPTPDGGYILGGQSNSEVSGDKSQPGQGQLDYWVIKITAGGDKQWDATFGGCDVDNLLDLAPTKDGGYILAGHSLSGQSGDKTEASRGNYDCWLVRLDAKGRKLWDRTLGGTGIEQTAAIHPTKDGGFVLGASSSSPVSGDKTTPAVRNGDYWVVKLDASGQHQWDQTLGGAGVENLSSLVPTKDGGYLLAGRSESAPSGQKTQPSLGGHDFWVVKLNAKGGLEWDQTLGGNKWDTPTTLALTADGGCLVGGTSLSDASGQKSQPALGLTDYWLVRLDAKGALRWEKALGAPYNDNLTSVLPTKDGGCLLGGWSISEQAGDKSTPSRGFFDYWVVKLGK